MAATAATTASAAGAMLRRLPPEAAAGLLRAGAALAADRGRKEEDIQRCQLGESLRGSFLIDPRD
jgi:hypothetical protein